MIPLPESFRIIRGGRRPGLFTRERDCRPMRGG
jgi:hypothetical protein